MRTGLTIDEFYDKSDGAQKFIIASMRFELDRERKRAEEIKRIANKKGRR